MGKWSFYEKCIRGMHHKEKGMLCQDRVAYLEQDNMQIAALVDGISQKDMSVVVFEKIAYDLVLFVAENMQKLLKADKLQLRTSGKYLMEEIRKKIEQYVKEYHLERSDCASTIMVFGLDYQNKEYLLIHLGDGIIISENKDGWNIESYPQNISFNGNRTYHTVTDSADENIKIQRGKIEDSVISFILLTDGNYDYPAVKEEIIEELKDERFWKESVNSRTDDRGIIIFRKQIREESTYDRGVK